MEKFLFKGAATALYTPLTNGKINFKAYERIIDEQIAADIQALVFMGTTGEGSTIEEKERTEIIKFAVKYVNKRIPVIIGCGSNSTYKARKFVEQAKKLGADGALCVTPYYNKCTQTGLIKHYEEIAKAKLPIIAYNVPSRTGFNATPETLSGVADIDYIVGIKEANIDKKHIADLFEITNDKIAIYSGNDFLNEYFYSLNSMGTISVLSNIIPCKIVEQFLNFGKFYENKNTETIKELCTAIQREINPIPIKAMLEILGKEGTELRLPLTKATDSDYEYFKSLLHKLKI